MLEQLLSNDIATGLGAGAFMAGAMYWLRAAPEYVLSFLKHQFTVEITIRNDDPAFYWVSKWLANHNYSKTARRVALFSAYEFEDTSEVKEWFMAPGGGYHWFRHGGRFIIVNRVVSNTDSVARKVRESLEIRILGRSQEPIRSLIEEARKSASGEDSISVHVWSNNYWKTIGRKNKRSSSSIILRDGQMDNILKDLVWFSNAKKWYLDRGIPYRRGYLFSGPPGTGKSSLISVLAGYTDRSLYILNLSAITDDNDILSAMTSAPKDAVIVLEDIDCASSSKSRKKNSDGEDEPGVTKAGLLNALDGVGTPEGRVVMMTTNYPEKLDDALIRPGRADVHERLDHLAPEAQVRMFEQFYGPGDYGSVGKSVSPAMMQSGFMRHPENPEAALDWIKSQMTGGRGSSKSSSSTKSPSVKPM